MGEGRITEESFGHPLPPGWRAVSVDVINYGVTVLSPALTRKCFRNRLYSHVFKSDITEKHIFQSKLVSGGVGGKLF